jgi:tetratricopeptide (TPR) repeat protein
MKRIISTIMLALLAPMYLHATDANMAKEYFNLAESYKEANKKDKVIENYKNSLRLDPNYFDAAFNLANFLYNESKITDAVDFYKKAGEIKPSCAQVHYNLGICLTQLNKDEEALKAFKNSTEKNPNYAKGHLQQGILQQKLNKNNAALEAYKKALEIDSKLFEAHYHIGILYKAMEELDTAIKHLDIAIELKPDHSGAIMELANTHNMLDNCDDCLRLYRRLLELNPNSVSALYNFGYTIKKMGFIEQALEIYNKVLTKSPDYGLAHFSRALTYLTLGDFDRGWPEYEWRWGAYDESPKKFKQPIWDGSDLRGKTILIYAEQGLGDTLQFIRYAKVLKNMGATVFFLTQQPLKDLIAKCPYIDKVATSAHDLPNFDLQIALMSIPMVVKTRQETVPAEIPYLFSQDNLDKEWKEKLSNDKNFKIGICWQGNSQYRTQFLRHVVAAKSMKINYFEPIAKLPGVSIYSLQKINGTDQMKTLDPSVIIHEFQGDFDNSHGRFMDTAAVMKNLDLVISVDTSICHLAGGLGLPVWVPLPLPADWRWMLDTETTPWYPNMRLFRQKKTGDWESVIKNIVAELPAYIAQHKAAHANSHKVIHADSSAGTPSNKQPIIQIEQELQCTANQTKINVTPLPLEELADKITMHVIRSEQTKEPANNETIQLQNAYEPYMQKLPKLKILSEQLLEANMQLYKLEEQLRSTPCSVFEQKFIDLARKAYYTANLKSHVKNQIHALAQQ